MSDVLPIERFEALFHQHYATVYRVLYRMVGAEADDVAQQVFLRLHHQLGVAPDTEVAAWLYRVATNLGYNTLRANHRRQLRTELVGRLDLGVDWDDGDAGPEAQVERDQEHQLVRAALARIGGRDARLLVLRYEGLSYRAVAEALGLAEGSIGTLLARAERAFERAYAQVSERRHTGGER